jgi:hypothetical protein
MIFNCDYFFQKFITNCMDSDLEMELTDVPGFGGVSARILMSDEAGMMVTGTPSVPPSVPPSQPTPVTRRSLYKEKLTAFWKVYAPEKLGTEDAVLIKYRGKEAEMFEKLKKKYTTNDDNVSAGGGNPAASSESSSSCCDTVKSLVGTVAFTFLFVILWAVFFVVTRVFVGDGACFKTWGIAATLAFIVAYISVQVSVIFIL